MYSKRFPADAIAHRGLHEIHSENSIPAFTAAIDAGARGIELDVHASSDDVLFVHHDAVVLSGSGAAALRSMDSRSITRLRLPRGESIPSLDEALEAIGSRADVCIEIKAPAIEGALVSCLRRHAGSMERYAVHSFDHRIVRRMAGLMPLVRTGILQASYLVDTRAAMRAAGASDLWQLADFIDEALVEDVHAFGGRIIAWTPDTEAEWKRLSDAGVDGICTNRVAEFTEWQSRR